MDKIGNILKQKRLEQGLTIEEISEKTRLTIKHIKAIEEGDISYFKDDLSYLRFFLKSYCDSLGLNFEEMKEELRLSIDDYTTSFTIKAVAQHEAIERGVKENVEKLRQPSQPKETKKKKAKKQSKRRKLDMSLVSFLAIVIVIIIALIFAFVMFIQNSKNSGDDVNNEKPPVAIAPTYTQDPETPKQPETPKEPEKKEMVITTVSDTEFTLENLVDDEDVDIEITFGSDSSLRALVDNKQLTDPPSQTYRYKSVVHVREKTVKDKKITLAFGYMKNNTIKINGKSIELPASVVNKEGTCVIQLTMKGE